MKTISEVIADFKKKYNFREIERSCWNCKHMEWDTCYDDRTRCAHPELFGRYEDDYEYQCQIDDTNNCVCDAWEPFK